MKFTLHYDGPLPSSGNKHKNAVKWEIRSKLHPQLVDLWVSHPALRAVEDNRHFPKSGGATLTQAHHLYPGPVNAPITGPLPLGYRGREPYSQPEPRELLDLCEAIEKHGAWFRPLVRDSYALHCGMKVRFLRKEPPGKVYQGGDIDGRIKTLVDALTMPRHIEQVLDRTSSEASPIYCLLEDDSLVSGFEVESERLLGDQDNAADWVKLIIEVDVRVRQATIYNQSFIG
ncbi:hypothetical protein [Bradyrhizobium sp. B120]|uniref:hypothetical protein n=1 Tax=Bradyrhizobium sp. B120 TaxID=3410088 RepID=UPI003B982294